jgi:hypothetical protein
MLEQIETIFSDMKQMMQKLKKASYQANTEAFTKQYGHYFVEMSDYMEAAGDKEEAASELSKTFIDAVENKYKVRGRVKPATQSDLNLFMVYYVFPSILKTGNEQEAKILADKLCADWSKRFKGSRIRYTSYEKLYDSFNEKILGISFLNQ